MSSAFAVAISFALLLMGAISLAALELVPPWAVPLAIGGSGALVVGVLYVQTARVSRARD
jgi:hypothetical protein